MPDPNKHPNGRPASRRVILPPDTSRATLNVTVSSAMPDPLRALLATTATLSPPNHIGGSRRRGRNTSVRWHAQLAKALQAIGLGPARFRGP